MADQSDAQATPAFSQRDIGLFLGESICTRRYIETIQYQTEGTRTIETVSMAVGKEAVVISMKIGFMCPWRKCN